MYVCVCFALYSTSSCKYILAHLCLYVVLSNKEEFEIGYLQFARFAFILFSFYYFIYFCVMIVMVVFTSLCLSE